MDREIKRNLKRRKKELKKKKEKIKCKAEREKEEMLVGGLKAERRKGKKWM